MIGNDVDGLVVEIGEFCSVVKEFVLESRDMEELF